MSFVTRIDNSASFSFSEDITYSRPYDDSQLASVVSLCERAFGARFTDNPSVRLDSIQRSENGSVSLRLSPVGFFGFLTTHYAWLNHEKLLASANEHEAKAFHAFIDKLEEDGIPQSMDEILARGYLANMLAISCLVCDERDRALLVVRNNDVGISTGFVSVSATGVIEREDVIEGDNVHADPVRACARRECSEELGASIPIGDFELVAIVCGREKLQPVALVNAKVPDIQEIAMALEANPGFASENTAFMVRTSHEVKELLASSEIQITEAGRAHLEIWLSELDAI